METIRNDKCIKRCSTIDLIKPTDPDCASYMQKFLQFQVFWGRRTIWMHRRLLRRLPSL